MNYKKLILPAVLIITNIQLHAAQIATKRSRENHNIARALMHRECGINRAETKKIFSQILAPETLACCSMLIRFVDENPMQLLQKASQAGINYKEIQLEDRIAYRFNDEKSKKLIPIHLVPFLNKLCFEQTAKEDQEGNKPERKLTKSETKILQELPIFIRAAFTENLNLIPYTHPCKKLASNVHNLYQAARPWGTTIAVTSILTIYPILCITFHPQIKSFFASLGF